MNMGDDLVEVMLFGEKVRVSRSFAESQGLPFKTGSGRKALRLSRGWLVSGVVVVAPCVGAVLFWLWILNSI